MKNALVIALALLSIALSAVSLAAYFSSANQTLELISHGRILFAFLGAVLLIATLPLKNKKAIVLATLAFLLNAAAIAPLYWPAAIESQASDSDDLHHIRLMQFNLWGGKNKKYVAVVQKIIETNPDVIGFSEITPVWLIALKAGLANYPYMIADTTGGGIAIFSRMPIESKEIRYYSNRKRPRAIAKIKLASGHFTLIFAHPFTPLKSLAIQAIFISSVAMRILPELGYRWIHAKAASSTLPQQAASLNACNSTAFHASELSSPASRFLLR